MALVITGAMIALGQASLLSEKSSRQILADLILRAELEALRAAPWSEVSKHHSTVIDYAKSHAGNPYPDLISQDEASLSAIGIAAAVQSAQLHAAGETGKTAFRILLNWVDRSGKSHAEARVLIITAGGISADS